MSTPADILSDSLRRLQTQQLTTPSDSVIIDSPKSLSRDGYGFRKSGISTPLILASTPDGPHHSQLAHELVPDPNGLGWPGIFRHSRFNNLL